MKWVHLVVHPDRPQDRNRRAGDPPVYAVHLEFVCLGTEREHKSGDATYAQRPHIDLEQPLFPNGDTEHELFLHTCDA